MSGQQNVNRFAAMGLTAAVVLSFAQLSSWLVNTYIALHDTIVVSAIVHFTHIRNTGAVFGLFPDNATFFALTSSAMVLIVLLYARSLPQAATYVYVALGCIVGGALSNVTDRLVYGAVIDFIDVQGIPRWHYIFNVADIAIHLGIWPLVLGELLRHDRPAAESQLPRDIAPKPPDG